MSENDEAAGGHAGDERARLLVAHPDEEARRDLAEKAEGELEVAGAVGALSEVVAFLAQTNGPPRAEGEAGEVPATAVDVLVLPLHFGEEDALAVLAEVCGGYPEVGVVVLERDDHVDQIREALRAGAREVLEPEPTGPRLRKVVGRVGRRQRERRHALEVPRPEHAGMWVFSNAGGGSGQTTMVLALANELADAGRKVAVVDLDLLFADVGFYLDVHGPGPDMSLLLRSGEDASPESLRLHLRSHESGVRVLLEPQDVNEAAGIDRAELVRVLLRLREVVDHVLIDLPPGIHDVYLPLLDEASFLFLTADGRIGGMKNLARLVAILREVGFPAAKIRPLIVGEAEEPAALERLRKRLDEAGIPDWARFPADQEAARQAILQAQPVTRVFPASPFSQAVRDYLAPLLRLQPRPADAQRPSLVQRLLGAVGLA